MRSERTFGTFGNGSLFYLLDTEQDPGYLRKIRHEMTHWIWGKFYGEAPALLNEGLATYSDTLSQKGADIYDLYKNLAPIESVPSLAKILQSEEFWKAGGHYRIGATLIHFLILTWGIKKLKTLFLRTEYNDETIETTMEKLYSISISELDESWRSSVKRFVANAARM